MKKVEVYDPALCCPTGVCGPSVDPELTRMATAVFILEKKGYDIKRFNLASEPAKFAENKTVNNYLHEKGPDALPLTLVDGEIVQAGTYPSNQQLAEWFEVSVEELEKKKSNNRINLI
ncbi:arsenite efflux transporter metallochaperone ArsD [Cytobacillus spongiae]|uniref:arsenite efflux transporter metallochaperone ArsD n=1 Tax=Cytobacillus spongiae TaxID=2901381 RepID=UPI001F2AF135|nr:arsenite efflux transporter metallochaperone ArsD [Cytobacillus spongiae]UII56264.1 arsenite efflux transporter metallochaperone ArsD [Cytobacillus spongiae]